MENEKDGQSESFASLSTKEPHLACSLSVTVPAAVVRTVAAVAVMFGGGGDGSQGNDRKQLKGGESESRTSSTRQPHASRPPGALSRPGPTDMYTWDSWQAGDKRARGIVY